MRHSDTGNWGGYTYRWNAGQTAATLVKGGLITHLPAPVNQDWIYPSEAQCLQCHTSAAGRSLGLETAQLNSDLTYPTTGRTANQLTTLNAIGMFATPLAQPPNALPAYQNPYGSSGTVSERARAYLHTNCAQCHRPSGGTPSNMDLRFSTVIGSTNTCNVAPNSGNLGIANARLIAPGNAANSLIYVRMNRRDLHQMPPLASNRVDAVGAALIQSWINAMNASCQ
jgi:mono/diheme cytochrome c family protein